MRPESHRYQEHSKRCGNCKHCHEIKYKNDDLCFLGDAITVEPEGFVILDGEDVSLMDGEEYSKVWGGRVVDPNADICDQWAAKE